MAHEYGKETLSKNVQQTGRNSLLPMAPAKALRVRKEGCRRHVPYVQYVAQRRRIFERDNVSVAGLQEVLQLG